MTTPYRENARPKSPRWGATWRARFAVRWRRFWAPPDLRPSRNPLIMRMVENMVRELKHLDGETDDLVPTEPVDTSE